MSPVPVEALERAGEITLEFLRSSGPGGQNVNKVETAVRLRFDLRGSRLLPPAVKARLVALAGRRLTAEGVLVLEARTHRTQERNRAAALARLGELIERAWRPPAQRRATRPTAGSRERRLEGKRHRAATKSARSRPADRE